MSRLTEFLSGGRGAAVVRLACTLAAGVLALAGVYLDVDVVVEGVACALALVCAVWSWWVNNNVTEAAQVAQRVLDAVREGDLSALAEAAGDAEALASGDDDDEEDGE